MDRATPEPLSIRSLLAPAKINLSLHVIGKRTDGYHRLDGVVVFAEAGDRLAIFEADEDRLAVVGPMAARLPKDDNILTRALAICRQVAARRGIRIGPLALTLEKNLPVAAGIGGGSADAASLLRWLSGLHPILSGDLRLAASGLGADLPMCFDGVPARFSEAGEIVDPLPAMPPLPLVLVNPGVAVETSSVFRALGCASNAPPPPLPEHGFRDVEEVVRYLGVCRNDLEVPARSLAPVIDEVAEHLLHTNNVRLVRMSGSGATVFGLYDSDGDAAEAAASLAQSRPGWWVVATRSRATRR